MKAPISKTILLIALFLSMLNSVPAQDGLDERIDDLLTDNIAKLEAAAVPPSMEATHRQNINDQRVDLIALLGQKKGEIKLRECCVSKSYVCPKGETFTAAHQSGRTDCVCKRKPCWEGSVLRESHSGVAETGSRIEGGSVRERIVGCKSSFGKRYQGTASDYAITRHECLDVLRRYRTCSLQRDRSNSRCQYLRANELFRRFDGTNQLQYSRAANLLFGGGCI